MSEPTSGDRQHPDPDHGREPNGNRDEVDDEVQDVTPDNVFNDPTAPVWADPTAPIPAEPPPTPPGAHPGSDQPAAGPASPQATPPVAPPVSNPYAQQPPVQPYGQPQPGQQYPAYGQQPYATGPRPEANNSAIVLTIMSGVSLVFCNFLALASLIFGILALTRNTTDPEGSRRLTKTGWIVFAVTWALAVLGIIAYVIFVVVLVSNSSGSGPDFNY